MSRKFAVLRIRPVSLMALAIVALICFRGRAKLLLAHVCSLQVFGASWCKPGEELYEEGVKVGAAIAAKGFKLINGGYSGTMEATAKGAALVGGTEIEGVVVPQLFQNRGPGGNEYLTASIPTATLLDRIQYMVQNSSYFIIMNGT
jgi:uncharacterized protein (TIGR00725 family)